MAQTIKTTQTFQTNQTFQTVLVTGGLGYIGSHICVDLLKSNYNIIIIDNLSNTKSEKLDLIKQHNIFDRRIDFYSIDLINYEKLSKIIYFFVKILDCKIDVIIHLAGLKSVSESIDLPIKYYENNLVSTLNLTKIMEEYSITNLIFSSSATVYGTAPAPYNEDSPTGGGITNPYGRSKYIQEEILKDIGNKNKHWNIVILRYFNPVGHLNRDFKEDPNGIPNNLFPYLLKVHSGELKELTIFGSNYETRDGTCTRDFIHVVDLANAHKICCDGVLSSTITGLKTYNVGTGVDTSVLELIKAFERVNGTKLNYKFGVEREGDIVTSYSVVDAIHNDLGWKSKLVIEDCVRLV